MLEFGKIDDAPPPAARRRRPSPAIEHAGMFNCDLSRRAASQAQPRERAWKCKTKPPRDIVERCPERFAKDLEWHLLRMEKSQKQTHFSASPRSGPEACAKDLEWHLRYGENAKQTHSQDRRIDGVTI
jgi:hypothetical protein